MGGIILINNSLKVAALFISAVIGAGFASGKEILTFFSQYDKASIYGLGLSGIVFFAFIYCLFRIIYLYKEKTDSFCDIFPAGVRVFYNILSYILLFSMYSVMIAGLSSWGNILFGIKKSLFGLICTMIFIVLFVLGKNALINSSLITTPVMCTGIIFTGIYYLLLSDKAVFNPFEKISHMWIISSLSYVSYNSIPLIALFWETKELFTSKEICFKGALFGCMSLSAISMVLDFLIKEFFVKVKVMDIPMLYISERIGTLAHIISEVILMLAMVSTALSSGFSLINILKRKSGLKPFAVILTVCMGGFIMSVFGFSNLVEYIYPLLGYAGFVIIIYIIWIFLSKHSIKYDKNIK